MIHAQYHLNLGFLSPGIRIVNACDVGDSHNVPRLATASLSMPLQNILWLVHHKDNVSDPLFRG